MNNGSERINERVRVYCYHPDDGKIMEYMFDPKDLEKLVTYFDKEIFFFMDADDRNVFFNQANEPLIIPEAELQDNLKEDFIWFQPGINKRSVMQCTCGAFLESADDPDDLIKPAIRHARRSGHTLNLKGN